MNDKTLFVSEFQRRNIALPTLSEIISSTISALTLLDYKAIYLKNALSGDSWNIVFGAHRLIETDLEATNKISNKNLVIFNLEPLHEVIRSPHQIDKAYIDLLKRFRVVDYSYSNLEILESIGVNNAFCFGFGFTKMTCHAFPSRYGPLTFYGKVTERRAETLNNLISEGVQVRVVDGVWGYERDFIVATSKAILNLSKLKSSPLEVYRIWHSLCLGVPVISERGSDAVLYKKWKDYILAPERLISTCKNHDYDLVSPDKYKKETCFIQEVDRLIRWIDI